VATPSITTVPLTLLRGVSGQTILVTGTATTFTGGAGFTISAGSIDQTVINSDTSATLIVTTQATPGPVALVDVGSGAACAINVPDPNSNLQTEAAKLHAILSRGVSHAVVDGQTVQYDLAACRKRLRDITRTLNPGLRPRVSTIFLGGNE
jgi:hypothetical protein